MRGTVKEIIEKLQVFGDDTFLELEYDIMPACPTCGKTHTVRTFNGYGWYCKEHGSFGRN